MLCKTDRVYCRNFRQEDFEDIHSFASQMDVVRYMAWGPNTPQETQDFLTVALGAINDKPRLRYDLAIIDKDSEDFIGGVSLTITDLDSGVGEIGYSINPKHWRKGYGTEAARAIIDFGFRSLMLKRLFATCDVRNTGSARVLEKAGMKREGVLKDHMLIRDGMRSSYLYSIMEYQY